MNRLEKNTALSREACHILWEKGTEPPFTGEYYNHHETGVYHCTNCGNPLFSSAAKYNSGTGWPSFFEPVDPHCLTQEIDKSAGMIRTEVKCANCDGHLGHVFDDGPAPTRKRFCINSAVLEFKSK